jgi:hypothetical protein
LTTYDALAEVGKSLRNLIWKYISVDSALNVDLTSADIIHAHPASTDNGKLCIFLYRMEEDLYQNDLPWDDDGTSSSLGKPPITLNLYYMIAPRYDTSLVDHILKDHLLLGKVMQIFYDNPVLRSPDLQGSLADETLNVRLTSPTLDEINKIWAMPDTNRYMIAAYYEVSPLRLDSSCSMDVKRVATFTPQLDYKT